MILVHVEETVHQLLQKVWSLFHKQMLVHIYEDFAVNRIRPKFLSLLLTVGVTERGYLKTIFANGEYPLFKDCV